MFLPPDENPRLTPRELDVLRGICRGEPYKTIAWKLGISEGTAKLHACSIHQKFGLHNKVQVALFALKHGLLD